MSDDLSAVHSDDALLDAISGSDPRIADELGEAELNALLVSWRREVDSEPMPELVDTAAAVNTIRAATLARRHSMTDHRRRMLVPVAAAAAVLAIAFTGSGLAAREAQPGDALWSLTKVLYADKARSVEAATEVRADFRLVRDALKNGDLDTARQMLEDADDKLQAVDVEENRDELEAEHDALSDAVDGTDSPPTENPEPTPPADSSSTSPEETSTSPDDSTSPSESSTPPPSSSDDPTTTSPPTTSSSDDGSTTNELPGISGRSSTESGEGDDPNGAEVNGAEANGTEST